jgi:hypothetical protein
VSVVVVCSTGAGPLAKTLGSLETQHVPVNEVVLSADGIDRLPPGFHTSSVDSLELLPQGTGRLACLNAGYRAARGRLVMLLDSGMELEPGSVEQLRDALRHNPSAAYAGGWSAGLDPSAVPLGNFANFVSEYDNAGVAPLIRREVFDRGHSFDPDLGPCAQRAFYAGLADDGLFGCVVPRRLVSWAPFSVACDDPKVTSRAVGPSPAAVDWAS